MNTFGRLFRVSILGESHGRCVGVLVDGCPSGLILTEKDFDNDLKRRRAGKPGTTARMELDEGKIMSGVFQGHTTGAPILILFDNQNAESSAYDFVKNTPRPGHADFTGSLKFGGFNDHRGGGHFSGRLTAGIVAAGVIAKKILIDVSVKAMVLEAGGSTDPVSAAVRASEENDSIGGVVECITTGLPPSLGEPFFDSVESKIAHAVFSIPGIKAIEFGAGFECAKMKGSQFNDALINANGKTRTNNSAGIYGGISNGNDITFRVAVRPTASIGKPQQTLNLETGKIDDLTIKGRHDACIALRIPVILEAVCALTLADLFLINKKSRQHKKEALNVD